MEYHKCDYCGKKFSYKYGYDEHMYYVDTHNMNAYLYRYKKANDLKTFMLDLMELNDNLCNIKNRIYEDGIKRYDCRTNWYLKNGYKKIAKLLKDNRHIVKEEYIKMYRRIIQEYNLEIDKINEQILRINKQVVK